MSKHICSKCGIDFTKEVERYSNDSFLDDQTCFTCTFWLDKVNMSEEERAAQTIVNGTHYMARQANDSYAFKGMGGAEFVIRYDDGRQIVCNNLWCQGKIPTMWRTALPDNAVFCKLVNLPEAPKDTMPF